MAMAARAAEFEPRLVGPREGIRQALAAAGGLVAVTDPADNPLSGGGADTPGLFALSRLDETGGETLVLFNTSTTAVTAQVEVEPASQRWQAVRGDCAAEASAPASYAVRIPPLDYLICKSTPQ
jgi:hypothetical protein